MKKIISMNIIQQLQMEAIYL